MGSWSFGDAVLTFFTQIHLTLQSAYYLIRVKIWIFSSMDVRFQLNSQFEKTEIWISVNFVYFSKRLKPEQKVP